MSKSNTKEVFLFSNDSEEIACFYKAFSSDFYVRLQTNPRLINNKDSSFSFVGKSFIKNIKSDFSSNKKFNVDIIGKTNKILSLKEKIIRASQTDLPVLILGESGSGKTFIAKKIHELSSRNKNEFLDINIAELSDSASESELFGVSEGTFTEVREREGFFSASDGGTLFLDEIGDASKKIQAQLLKAVESGEFRKVGSTQIQKSNVRLIFATNADLKSKMKNKEFRLDLFYRISNIIINVPPLRERKDDIELISFNYLENSGIGKRLSKSALEKLIEHDWPGNIRELQCTLDRAILNAWECEEILPEHIEIY